MNQNNPYNIIKSSDGSCTAYSSLFKESYHSTKDGAIYETYHKHVLPAFDLKKNKKEVHILDICFGLGFNTLATIHHYQKYSPKTKLYIYTPEFDTKLLQSLHNFQYPKEFKNFKEIIHTLIKTQLYSHKNIYIELYIGDARDYIKKFNNTFDIIYQDAFSPKNNPSLWTIEYFQDIAKAIKTDGILTTYSIALQTRLALYKNNFFIYLKKGKKHRDSTIASLESINFLEEINMPHKIKCNPKIKPLSDQTITNFIEL